MWQVKLFAILSKGSRRKGCEMKKSTLWAFTAILLGLGGLVAALTADEADVARQIAVSMVVCVSVVCFAASEILDKLGD